MATGTWPPLYRIHTPRVVLRCFELADAVALHTLLRQHHEELGSWLDLPKVPDSIEAAATRITRFRRRFDAGQRFSYAALVDGELAGALAVEPIAAKGLLLGGWVRPTLAARGLASEALAAACHVGFTRGARYVELRIRTDNEPSQVLARRLGFRHEATLAGRVLSRGRVYDEMIWTLPSGPIDAPTVCAFDAIGRAA